MRPRLSPLSVRQRLQNGSERMFKEGGLRAETVAMLGATEEPIVKKVAVSLLKWEDLGGFPTPIAVTLSPANH